MKAMLQRFKWSERPAIRKEVALALSIGLAGLLAYFKLRPYYEVRPRITAAPTHEPGSTGLKEVLGNLMPPHAALAPERRHPGFASRGPSDRRGPAVLERPLFDGLTVLLRGVLLNSVSSFQPDAPVEVSVLSLIRDDSTPDLDESPALDARLVGTMAANMASKRIGFSFSELISKEGRSYPVRGTAFDLATRTTGIAANYSSGLGSRLLGVGLDQGISLANQVATNKILESTTGSSTTAEEIQAAATVISQQASNSISTEATQDLRTTPAELSLPAGTAITIRLRATPSAEAGHP